MRTLFLLALIGSLPAAGQYVENLIDLEVSLTYESAVGPKDQNGIRTFHSNMTMGYGFNVGAAYMIKNNFKAGIRYGYREFINHRFEEELPLLGNPKSQLHEYLVDLSYLIGKKNQFGLNVSTGYVNHNIKIDQLKIFSDNPPENTKLEFKESEFIIEAGFIGMFDITYNLKFLGKLSYRYMTAGNQLYVDKNLQGLGISIGVIKKIVKNKSFQYE